MGKNNTIIIGPIYEGVVRQGLFKRIISMYDIIKSKVARRTRAILRISGFAVLLAISIYLVIKDTSFPTYAAGGFIGVCITVIFLPFVYKGYLSIKKIFLPNTDIEKGFIKSWYKTLLFDPVGKAKNISSQTNNKELNFFMASSLICVGLSLIFWPLAIAGIAFGARSLKISLANGNSLFSILALVALGIGIFTFLK